jgi:hypothetical protein
LSLTGFDAVAFCQILDFDHGLKEEGPELFASSVVVVRFP